MSLYRFKNSILLFFIAYFIFLNNLFAESFNTSSATVFMYHRFDEFKYPSTNIKSEQLKKHLIFITSNKYNIITNSTILSNIESNKQFLPKTISFTIDDAFLSFYQHGWPIFKKYKIPVTLFISTDVIDELHWNYMSWDNIRSFIAEGGSVGLHSASHAHLPLKNIDQVENDLTKSMKRFKEELGFIPDVFAYPYGEASNDIQTLLKKLGIKYAFGQHSGLIHNKSDLYYLPRFSLNENYGDIERFIFLANLKPLIVENFIPNEIFLTKNSMQNIEFDILSKIDIEQLNCFSNSDGSWSSLNIDSYTKNRVSLKLDKPFLSGRGRLNCTIKKNDEWLWFGHQFTIK